MLWGIVIIVVVCSSPSPLSKLVIVALSFEHLRSKEEEDTFAAIIDDAVGKEATDGSVVMFDILIVADMQHVSYAMIHF